MPKPAVGYDQEILETLAYKTDEALLTHPHYGEYLQAINNNEVPRQYPGPRNGLDLMAFRAKGFCNARGVFPTVDQNWTAQLTQFLREQLGTQTPRILEPAAGRGYLTLGLQLAGAKVHASDNYAWHHQYNHLEPVANVEKLDGYDAIRKYAADCDVLLLSWPPYESNLAYGLGRLWHELSNGKPIVFIGEGWGGCTADDAFFEHYTPTHERITDHQTWDSSFHDSISFGTWNPQRTR